MRKHAFKQFWLVFIMVTSLLRWGGLVIADDAVEISSQPDIEQGQEIYQVHCLECHGVHGYGDGPRAATLEHPPGTLVSSAMDNKTDDELLVILAAGVPQTTMRGWSDQLSLDDRRNVLAYVRSLAFSP